MDISTKIILHIFGSIILLTFIALLIKRYAPKYETFFPLLISVIALAVSLVSNFKNELFGFRLNVITTGITLACPSAPSHRSMAIILPTYFINEGYGCGVIEWIAMKIINSNDNSIKQYIPIAEVDYVKFIQGKHVLHSENIMNSFDSFPLGAREVKQKYVLLTQDEKNSKYPFNEWLPGDYVFEIYVKTIDSNIPHKVSQIEFKIDQKTLDQYFAGVSIDLKNRIITF
jgi:hypothetical protein